MSRAKNYRNRTTIVKVASGQEFELRRPDVQAWLRNGRAPQLLTKLVFDEATRGKFANQTPEQSADQLTAEELAAMLKFQVDVVSEAMVSPRLVVGNEDEAVPAVESLGDDDLLLRELDPQDFLSVFRWVMTGSPSAPVRLNSGGETTLAAVVNFRAGGQGPIPAPIGADVRTDGRASEQALGAA